MSKIVVPMRKLDRTYQLLCETYLKIILKQSNLEEHAANLPIHITPQKACEKW